MCSSTKGTTLLNSARPIGFLGARPQTPKVGFAEVWAVCSLPRSGTTLFASFSGKRRSHLDQLVHRGSYAAAASYSSVDHVILWGHAPKPPGSAPPRVGQCAVFHEAEQRFCFFFWKKKISSRTMVIGVHMRSLDHVIDSPVPLSAEFWIWNNLLRSKTNLLVLFPEKKRSVFRPMDSVKTVARNVKLN
jgi:hypothetical protein